MNLCPSTITPRGPMPISAEWPGRWAPCQVSRLQFHKKARHIIWGDLALTLCEPVTPSAAERSVLRNTEIHGLECLQNALRDGQGAILWESNGFGRRNLVKGLLYEKGFSVNQVHADNHLICRLGSRGSASWLGHSMIRPFFNAYEKKFVADIVYLPRSNSLTFTRTLLSLLQQNGILCVTGDSHYDHRRMLCAALVISPLQ